MMLLVAVIAPESLSIPPPLLFVTVTLVKLREFLETEIVPVPPTEVLPEKELRIVWDCAQTMRRVLWG